MLRSAGLIPPPEPNDSLWDWESIDGYLYREFHLTPPQLDRLTQPECLDMLPKQEAGTGIGQAETIYYALQKLTPEQWLTVGELMR